MNITTYFLKHPVASIVLNCMIILLGVLAGTALKVREYPNVTFPTVTISTSYPNASAKLVESSVTNILEDNLAGIEGIDTITSSSQQGGSDITLNFRRGTSIDQALIAIRDAIGIAKGHLPMEDIKEPIVERQTKSSGMPFIVISLESTTMMSQELTHYAQLTIKNSLRSVSGVSSVDIWGQPYCYKITLDQEKLFLYGINPDEVITAISKSDRSIPTGKFQNIIPATLNLELNEAVDFEEICIRPQNSSKINSRQQPIFLRDIASITLGSNEDLLRVRINGNPGVAIGVQKVSDGNPLEISKAIMHEVQALQKALPDGVKINIISDQAEFIRSSIANIESSLIEAIVLVLCVVFLFLRSFRATLIPLITIPISLIGSLLLLQLFGFSLNIMTLLAMVLAVGLVVDDAIVVLENISRYVEEGMEPMAAAFRGSKEIGFAVVAMTATLMSVYAPIAFMEGAVGQLFIEFAVALSGSVLISGIVALTLSPLMCGILLKPHTVVIWSQIDYFFERISHFYLTFLEKLLKNKKMALLFGVGSIGVMVLLMGILPREMAPKEDRCFISVWIPEITSANIDILENRVMRVEKIFEKITEGQSVLSFIQPRGAYVALPLIPQTKRKRSAQEVVDYLNPQMNELPSADGWLNSWDSGLPGLDQVNTSQLSLVVSTLDTYEDLFKHLEIVKKKLNDRGIFSSTYHDLALDTLGYQIEIDKDRLAQLNLSEERVATAIAVFFSGNRSLTFDKDGILYPLMIQGRTSPWRLDELYLTNSRGKRICLGSVATMKPLAQPKSLKHYEEMRSATLNVELPSHISVPQGMPKLMEEVAQVIPSHYKTHWIGAAKAYLESSSAMYFLFVLALAFIYAILSLQFDNFLDPLIVLLTVPLGCAGALLMVWLFNGSINVYTQVGLITLIGLITKHGILIVEFSNTLYLEGLDWKEAIEQAAKLRLRPILMTTATTIFGALPLLLSRDAGYEARMAIGVILLGGLSFGTLFTLFILPVACLEIKKRFSPTRRIEHPTITV